MRKLLFTCLHSQSCICNGAGVSWNGVQGAETDAMFAGINSGDIGPLLKGAHSSAPSKPLQSARFPLLRDTVVPIRHISLFC